MQLRINYVFARTSYITALAAFASVLVASALDCDAVVASVEHAILNKNILA